MHYAFSPLRASLARLSDVRRAGDADFGDDCGDEFVRRYIERRIENGDTFRNDARTADMRHFCRRALLDRDVRAVRYREIQRGQRRSDIEGNVMLPRKHGDGVGSDLVGHVTVGRNAIRTDNHSVHKTLPHEGSGHIVRDHAYVDVVFPELPRRQSSALQKWPCLVGEDLQAFSAFDGGADHPQGRAVTGGGQRPGVAVRQDRAGLRQKSAPNRPMRLLFSMSSS